MVIGAVFHAGSGPPNLVAGLVVHNNIFIFRRAACENARINRQGTGFGLVSLVIARQRGINLMLVQLIIRQIVIDFFRSVDTDSLQPFPCSSVSRRRRASVSGEAWKPEGLALSPSPCASLLAGTEGDSTPIAARRFQTTPASVVARSANLLLLRASASLR